MVIELSTGFKKNVMLRKDGRTDGRTQRFIEQASPAKKALSFKRSRSVCSLGITISSDLYKKDF